MDYHLLLDSDTPRDKGNLARFIFVALGIGLLFPWNAFITASDFFSALYPDIPFIFYLSLACNYSSCFCLFLSIKIMPRFSFGLRILTCLTIVLVLLTIVPFLNLMFTQESSMVMTLIGCFLIGSATSILFGSVLGLAALFPLEYTGAVMSGSGVAGILASALRISTKGSLPRDSNGLQQSGILYFLLAAVVILLCIMSYLVLTRLPITAFYLSKYYNKKSTETERLVNGSEHKGSQVPVKITELLRKIWKEVLVVFWVFFVTLSLFPGMTNLVRAQEGSLLTQDWYQIVLVGIFMVGDVIGRTAPRWERMRVFAPSTLWVPTVLRVVFFLLFLMLCSGPGMGIGYRPSALQSDAAAFAVMALFSLSNGYCGTLAMMYGPSKADPHEREVAGIIMSFALNFGVFLGVHFALLLLYLVTGSIGVN